MKRIYTFTVHETYAGSRDGEITVEIESLADYNGMMEEAKEIAYDKYKSGNVEWEDRRGYYDEDKDYDIDLDSSYLVDDDGYRIRGDEDE